MPVKLTNQTKNLLVVTLNGGTSLHLAPGETSPPVDDIEVNGNDKIEKLRRRGQLTVAYIEG